MKKKCLLACEILWDCFPYGDFLGGATLNVAYHLNQLNTLPIIASSVGDDESGRNAITQIRDQWGCDISGIRILEGVATGKVFVQIDHKGDATYILETPAAWDFVSLSEDLFPGFKNADAFVYGSVGLRMDFNQQQTEMFLKEYKGLKCFDVNLRIPHNSRELVLKYAGQADFVKVNNEELEMLTNHLNAGSSVYGRIAELSRMLDVDMLCVTRADRSALMLYGGQVYEGQVFPVAIIDTVGAGDAFFAAMIDALLNEDFNPRLALDKATALGSWVASKQGAQPPYDKQRSVLETLKL